MSETERSKRTTIGKVARVLAGIGFPPALQGRPSGDVPFAKVGDISAALRDGTYELTTAANYVSRKEIASLRARIIPPGSTVFAKIGEAIKLNRRALTMREFLVDNNVMAIVPGPALDQRFLLQFMRTVDLYPIASATTVPSLRGSSISDLELDLPPLPEQRRIVAKLDSLQARSRRAKEALDAISEQESRLVRYFSAWPRAPLGPHVVERRSLVGLKWGDFNLVGLSNAGRIVERREPIGLKTAPNCRLVLPGDIVFNPIRFSIGSIARYYGTQPVIVSPEYVVFHTRPTLSAEVLVRYLRSSFGRNVLDTETQGSVRYRVYFRNLQALMMPLAPQHVMDKGERLFLGLRSVLLEREYVSEQISRLDRAILAKAFRGELVPQDPGESLGLDAPHPVVPLRSGEGHVVASRRGKASKKGR